MMLSNWMMLAILTSEPWRKARGFAYFWGVSFKFFFFWWQVEHLLNGIIY